MPEHAARELGLQVAIFSNNSRSVKSNRAKNNSYTNYNSNIVIMTVRK